MVVNGKRGDSRRRREFARMSAKAVIGKRRSEKREKDTFLESRILRGMDILT